MKNAIHRLSWHDGIELLDANVTGHPFGKHSHDAYAIGVIELGVGGNVHRGERKIFPPQSLSLINPDEMHDGFSVSESIRYKVLYITEASMSELVGLRALHGFRNEPASDFNGSVATALKNIQTLLAARDHAGWRLAVDSDVTCMVEAVLSRYSRNQIDGPGIEPRSIAIVKEYLNDSIGALSDDDSLNSIAQSVSLKTLADLVQLKPNYLLTTFTQHVGVPPYAYWMARRIDVAKRLLAQRHSISRVAHQLGFYDQAHFSRAFKRATGITPGQIFSY